MKTRLITAGSFLLIHFFLFTACGDKSSPEYESQKKETPKALQDDRYKISYSRTGIDLVDELYNDLMDQDESIRQLDQDIRTYKKGSRDLEEEFRRYDSKSESYYASSSHQAAVIRDSMLRKRIDALIYASENKYAAQTIAIKALLSTAAGNSISLSDRHSALKIVLTLPLIEKYQKNELPDKKEFNSFIKEQKRLIQKTDSLLQ